jgi:hypothetical protein
MLFSSPVLAEAASPPSAPLAAQQVVRQWQWQPLIWTRQPGAAKVAPDDNVPHDGRPSTRIEHTGANDWSLQPVSYGSGQPARFDVTEGDLLEVSAWIKSAGRGDAAVSVVTYNGRNEVVEWLFGARTTGATEGWVHLQARMVIPAGVATIMPRLTGNGPATVWMEGFALAQKGNVAALGTNLSAPLTLENDALSVSVDPRSAALSVVDRRTKQTWSQEVLGRDLVVVGGQATGKLTAEVTLLDVPFDLRIKVTFHLEPQAPELEICLSADGDLPQPLQFPHPFAGRPKSHLIVPLNEGIDYPAEDESIRPMRLDAYSGHGICMAFWGLLDGDQGPMAIIETPDDAAIRISRSRDGLLGIAPEWDSQKGRFGYERKLRYVFFDRGGYVAMCKRYRSYAQQVGLFETLQEKRRDNPNVDLLVGAVNVWCWEKDALGIVREMTAAGIDRILWSSQAAPETIKALNDLGVLTSRYDIYQDVMDPAMFSRLRWTHPDWTTAAWPKNLMLNAQGDWIKGWPVEAQDGTMIPCGVVCDRQAMAYADRRIGEDLKDHAYRCRFIDTTTASPWRECYSSDHPMTRTDSRKFKMQLLDLVSNKYKLVCGSETGHDAAVPYVHYFEGMLSLGPYRVPDAGRLMDKIYDEVPPDVAKFQLGHQYRLPLWELVYHDCIIAQWYWGDYNNKLPALWDKRDLFNALYGTPPMFMFNRALWNQNKERFARSYRAASPVARATAYCEMTDHRCLTVDRSVQQTRFANGVVVTVNFGTAPYRMADGSALAPTSVKVLQPKSDQP